VKHQVTNLDSLEGEGEHLWQEQGNSTVSMLLHCFVALFCCTVLLQCCVLK
jgi:hypothetical protein